MKKIIYLLCIAASFAFCACDNEEDDLFDSSSAIRADEAIKADTKILTDAANGWLMEYYPEASQSYGGYNMLLKFGTDGKVTAASELYNGTDATEGLYSVKQSAGVVLSFDTYNEIFHLFSDPSDPLGVGGSGYGLEGDYDFLILEASADKVVLKGKKTGGIATMTPMKGDWAGYITSVQEAKAAMSFSKYRLDINGTSLDVAISFRTLTFIYTVGEESHEVKAAYIQTPTGYKFYEPVEVNGVTLTGFTFDTAAGLFKADNQSNVTLVPIVPPLNEQLVASRWYFAYSAISAPLQPYFAMAAQGSAGEGEDILYLYMGPSESDGTYSFGFRSGKYLGYLTYNYELIGEDEIALQFAMAGDNNGIYYHNNCNYNYPLSAIGYSTPKTYKLETDNVKEPTWIKLTNTADETKYFTLYANLVAYPFDN